MTEIPKIYNPKDTEERIYKLWEESGFFNPDNLLGDRKKRFVAAIAPPNITGELHIGHALEHTLQDIIIRMKRMQGYKVLWLPGTDHAGIAAQNKVEKQLAKEGLSRHQLGREKFLERMWQWREKYGNIILDQFKKLGLSVDWSRAKFTMDPSYQKAVEFAFKKYQEKGWIYQGERVINWCPRCATSISDLEVNYVPEKGKLYFIKYGPLTLATARPETKLGDTALAVHPSDKRYGEYVGKDLEIDSVDSSVPLNQPAKSKKIKIKVVADQAVDPEFGTGIIKVTPAHDITDYEISQRHSLSLLKVIDERGKMNENAGIRYQGMKIGQAREQIVKDLSELGLIERTEDYEHNIGRCDRCDSVIEPLPSKQWFLKMKELAGLALEALEKEEIKIYHPRWKDQLISWLNNVRDWNISRQLWWGHKIPIDGEEDVLDTWFSSALWPFAVMGWPIACAQDKKSKIKNQNYCEPLPGSDLAEYYPTQLITSDRGILFLWQARMIFSGKFFTGKAPFNSIYIHATVLTKNGKRMSKSLGTGIDPLAMIDKYGSDALRFGLAYQTTDLQDMRFGEDAILMGKKFANKLWNIARYVRLNISGISNFEFLISKQNPENELNKEILEKMETLAKSVTQNIEKYKFGEAAHELYDFIWHELADKYIEETKDKNNEETKQTLAYLLVTCLKLLHPFMPFITEEIYSQLPIPSKNLLLIEPWPS